MIAVTGGAGFIGVYTVKMLRSLGYEVLVIDNLSRARSENVDELEKLGVEIAIIDIRKYGELETSLKDVERVIHLAALISVEESIEKPRLYCQVNTYGTVNLLKACIRHGVKRVVYASSAAVYGEPRYLPIDEGHPLRPLSPYGASKLSGEFYCLTFNKLGKLETVILRYFNVYGPGQSESYAGVITSFVKSIVKDKPPIIYGNGNQTRDFIFVEDVAKANINALFKEDIAGHIFNIATGKPVRIKDLAYSMLKLLKKENFIEPIHLAPRPGDIRDSYADVSFAMNRLGFKPKTGLKEGLMKTIKYYEERIFNQR